VTPRKRRYATPEAAHRDTRELCFIAGGQVMRAYRCCCGWWHLTRRGADPLPAERGAA
jgi:hypothetical protein